MRKPGQHSLPPLLTVTFNLQVYENVWPSRSVCGPERRRRLPYKARLSRQSSRTDVHRDGEGPAITLTSDHSAPLFVTHTPPGGASYLNHPSQKRRTPAADAEEASRSPRRHADQKPGQHATELLLFSPLGAPARVDGHNVSLLRYVGTPGGLDVAS